MREQLEREIQAAEDHLRDLLEQYQELCNCFEEPEEWTDPLEFIHVLHAQAFDDNRRR